MIKKSELVKGTEVLGINQQEKINSLVQDENYKYWLGGFAEGEGAVVISIVKNDKVTIKVVLQPEFNVAQHESGINILYSYKSIFENFGHVVKKSGSDKVWVYSLKGTQNIKKYVLPFFEKYIVPFSCKYIDQFNSLSLIINKLDSNKKKTMEKGELIELVKLVYLMNPEGKGKQRKRTLEEIIDIINGE
jgi:hypothetical protein